MAATGSIACAIAANICSIEDKEVVRDLLVWTFEADMLELMALFKDEST